MWTSIFTEVPFFRWWVQLVQYIIIICFICYSTENNVTSVASASSKKLNRPESIRFILGFILYVPNIGSIVMETPNGRRSEFCSSTRLSFPYPSFPLIPLNKWHVKTKQKIKFFWHTYFDYFDHNTVSILTYCLVY